MSLLPPFKINMLQLQNFRGIKSLNIEFNEQVTIFAGKNGAGKSSILDALAMSLSWIIARVRHAGTSGRLIQENDIYNTEAYALIKVEGKTDLPIVWQLFKGKKGKPKSIESSVLHDVSNYAKNLQVQLTEHNILPLFVYYPVNRAVLDIPLRIRKKHKFEILEAYEVALTSAADFRQFFEWFRNREDLENEEKAFYQQKLNKDDVQLSAVRKALEIFLSELTQFRVRRNPLCLTAIKQGIEIQVNQLSDGEKCLIALIGDLARRLAIANPSLLNPLEGAGIVLIDELELHLHPAWQRQIIRQLTQTFPNCQFVLTTHSPQILGEVEGKNIRLLHRDNDTKEIVCYTPKQALGLDSAEVTSELMQAEKRDIETTNALKTIFDLIDKEDFSQAKVAIDNLKHRLNGDIPDIVQAEALITMLAMDNEHHD
ncbi:putative ATP-binding protein involved in virulence [Beggiatoa alba B18LD]|uniref:Putative ATP-binding protein involved in virulence n=1 Tax=Beggiatoa alba B18LD TaxID=395493 RepID=I3CE92_9GAMM|nr:AAA family ATPase [Beggiatoa alba]EIJ41935.1 putative ATP-binding protein involved in virulence [Beggiatoa alba B18LD]